MDPNIYFSRMLTYKVIHVLTHDLLSKCNLTNFDWYNLFEKKYCNSIEWDADKDYSECFLYWETMHDEYKVIQCSNIVIDGTLYITYKVDGYSHKIIICNNKLFEIKNYRGEIRLYSIILSFDCHPQILSGLTDVTHEALLIQLTLTSEEIEELNSRNKKTIYTFSGISTQLSISYFKRNFLEFKVIHTLVFNLNVNSSNNLIDKDMRLLSNIIPFHYYNIKDIYKKIYAPSVTMEKHNTSHVLSMKLLKLLSKELTRNTLLCGDKYL